MTKRTMLIPTEILIDGDFWAEGTLEERSLQYVGTTIVMFNDSGGEMWCAFETADQAGVQLISLGSRFFLGFVGMGQILGGRERD